MICPHCHFRFVGPGIPREAPENFFCPICGNNMSDPPIPPFTGAQKFGKNLATILLGLPLVLIGVGLTSAFKIGIVALLLALLAMVAIEEYLGEKLKKMPSVAARWWLIFVVAIFPIGVIGVVLLFSSGVL